MRSPVEWTIRVGTRIAETTSRTSISNAIRMNVAVAAGLADCIIRRPNHSIRRVSSPALGTMLRIPRPFPHHSAIVRIASSCSSRVASPQGQSPVVSSFTSLPQSRSAAVRSG